MTPMADETKDIHSGSGFETKDAFHPGMYAPAAVPNTDLNTTEHAAAFATSETAPAPDDDTPGASEAETPAPDASASTARKTPASKTAASK